MVTNPQVVFVIIIVFVITVIVYIITVITFVIIVIVFFIIVIANLPRIHPHPQYIHVGSATRRLLKLTR